MVIALLAILLKLNQSASGTVGHTGLSVETVTEVLPHVSLPFRGVVITVTS